MRNLMASVIIGIVALTLGCGGPKTAEVSGKVTFDGQPGQNIRVLFQPSTTEALTPEPGFGLTDGEGNFTLRLIDSKKKGVVPGEYAVIISWADPNADPNPIEGVTVANVCPYKIPTKATSGEMRFTVPEGGTKEANFEFDSKTDSFKPRF
jgi:hypothetical protein